MEKRDIIHKQVILFVFTSCVAVITCFAHTGDKDQDFAVVDIQNDEDKEIQVYIQSGDGKTIGTASHQISFKVPPKKEKSGKKQIKVRKSEMGGESTFSVIGGTGTFDTLMSFDNRCKGLRFGEKHELVFKPTQTGGTLCEAKSAVLSLDDKETSSADVKSKKSQSER